MPLCNIMQREKVIPSLHGLKYIKLKVISITIVSQQQRQSSSSQLPFRLLGWVN